MQTAGPTRQHLMDGQERADAISRALRELPEGQVRLVELVLRQLGRPHSFARDENSDIVSERLLQDFGDALRLHHCFSSEAFTKDKFEHTLERVCAECGWEAELARRGNRGHDITINGERVSLKTQADGNIRPDVIWISKFMELGRGDWTDRDEDLVGLREQFFRHMEGYDRVLSLRRLRGRPQWHYELVEIPKTLLLEARGGQLRMMHDSRQMPKPGYCYVTDDYRHTSRGG